jgi:23S rRNA (cytosine1962-C5)-methyltransferase
MMIRQGKIILKKGKDTVVSRQHPWIFSGAIQAIEGDSINGFWARIYSASNEYLATGYYSSGSIAVRIVTFEDKSPGYDLWKEKITNAYNFRHRLGFINNTETNAYRLLFGENDGLPGTIIDIYDKTAVLQAHTKAMFDLKEDFADILKEIYGGSLQAVYDKSAETLNRQTPTSNGYLWGQQLDKTIIENGNKFYVDWEEGQKTGFFLDQRDNRKLLTSFASGRKILNLFSYSGAFSVYGLATGAREADSIDSSLPALKLAEKNVELNNLTGIHKVIQSDAIDYISKTATKYDLIIIDPPAFAKHLSARHHAIQAYKRINLEAINKIQPGGIIFTFSCSQVIDRSMFNSTIISAAIESKRNIRIIHQLGQAPDHPINSFFPEGEYLKGLVLYVE